MADKLKVNRAFEKALKQLMERKVVGPQVKWSWQEMRHTIYKVVVNEMLPEFGIDSTKATMVEKEVVKDGKKTKELVPNELMEEFQNARKAFDEAFDEPWCVESSNCGKHCADQGFARNNAAEAKVASDVFV